MGIADYLNNDITPKDEETKQPGHKLDDAPYKGPFNPFTEAKMDSAKGACDALLSQALSQSAGEDPLLDDYEKIMAKFVFAIKRIKGIFKEEFDTVANGGSYMALYHFLLTSPHWGHSIGIDGTYLSILTSNLRGIEDKLNDGRRNLVIDLVISPVTIGLLIKESSISSDDFDYDEFVKIVNRGRVAVVMDSDHYRNRPSFISVSMTRDGYIDLTPVARGGPSANMVTFLAAVQEIIKRSYEIYFRMNSGFEGLREMFNNPGFNMEDNEDPDDDDDTDV